MRFSDRLMGEGVFAQPVVFPTVALDQRPHPDDRHRGPRRRPPRPGAGGVLDRRTGAGGDLGVSRATGGHAMALIDRQARDLPLDAHLHTDLSPDSDVPIDAYAAAGRRARASPSWRSPTMSTSSRARRRYGYTTFEQRERIVREAAERWADRGVAIRFGVEITWDSRLGGRHPRSPRHATPTTSSSARSTSIATRRTPPTHVAGWVAGSVAARDRRALLRRGRGRLPGPGCSTRSATSTSSSASCPRT